MPSVAFPGTGGKALDPAVRWAFYVDTSGGVDACHLYSGKVNSNGYGQFWLPKPVTNYVLAHKHAWNEANGSIPNGLCVLHTCDVRLCVNVKHLYLGTHKQNSRDMVDRGRNVSPLKGRVPAHGTMSRYTYHKCRCDICKAANTAYYRIYRKRREQ